MKVALSAGHYPAAPGAVHGTLTEHAMAVYWREALSRAVEAYGLDVFMVPVGALPMKCGAVNAERCDLAVEIHFNSDPLHRGRGSETLYMPASTEGYKLAQAIQQRLGRVCPPDRGPKEAWYRMDRPGHIDYAGDTDGDEVVAAFCRLIHCPAVIVEPCFIHEPRVGEPDTAVEAIAAGIATYALLPV